jgi:hypothetical protein
MRMIIGELVHDCALGMNGIIIDDDWIEVARPHSRPSRPAVNWEWLVLYEDGALSGANTMDLQVAS